MTGKEKFEAIQEGFNGDFWRAVEYLAKEGWRLSDFEGAGIRETFNNNFDNPLEENMAYLGGIILDAVIGEVGGSEDKERLEMEAEAMKYARRHENIWTFFHFLEEVLRPEVAPRTKNDRWGWVCDLEDFVATTGKEHFEIHSSMTRDSKPVTYHFKKEWFTNEDGEEDYKFVHFEE